MTQKKYPPKSKTHKKKGGGRHCNQTARKLADEVARQAEALLAESQQIFHLGSWNWDMATGKIQFSDEMFRLVGMLPGQVEITDEGFIKFFHPDEIEQLHQDLKQGVFKQYSSIDHRIILPNGEIRYLHTRVKAYKDENGFPLRLLGSTQDFTDQKRVQEALKESEWRNRIISELTTDYIFVVDVDPGGNPKLRWASDNMFRMTGRKIEDAAMPDMWGNMIHPDHKVGFFGFMNQILSTAEAGEFECRAVNRYGKERWVKIYALPQAVEGNSITTIVGAVKDITERRLMETQLEKSHNLLVEIEKLGKIGGWEFDIDTQEQTWTEEIYRIHEVDESYVPTVDKGLSFYTAASRPIIEKAIQRTVEFGEPYDLVLEFITAKGNLKWVHAIGQADIEHHRVFGLFQDVTERTQAEDMLRQSEEKYRFLIENMKDVVWQISPDLRFTYSSPTDEIQRGYKPEEILGRSIFDFMALESKKVVMERTAARQALMQQGERVKDAIYEIEQIRKDGKHIWTEVNSIPVYDTTGHLTHFQGVTRDITLRKQAEEALRQSEEKYRFLIENMKDVIWQASPDLRFTFISHADEFLGGYKSEELLGKSIFDYMTQKSKNVVMGFTSARQNLLQQGEKIGDAVYEVEHIRKKGGYMWVEVSVYPMYDAAGRLTHFQGVTRDISQRKQAETLLKKSRDLLAETERMGSVGGWEFDIDTNEQIWTEEVYRIHEVDFTYKPTVSLGLNFYADAARPIIEKAVQRAIEHGEPFDVELEIITAKGNQRWVHAIGKADLENRRIFGFFQNITGRKQMEKDLRESEARNRAMVEAIPDLMFVQSRAGVYVDYHAANSQLLIAPPEAFLGRTTRAVLPPALIDVFQAKFDLAFQTGQVQTHEYLLDVLDGRHYFESRMIAYGDDRLLSIVRDITERKQAEQKLLAMEEFQHVLLNATKSTSILLLNSAGAILAINEYGAQLVGKHPDELLGRHIFEIFPADNAATRAVLDARKAHFDEVCRTASVMTFEDFRQGIWFENSFYPILDAAGNIAQVAVYARNITERKNNEERLRQSEQWYRALSDAAHDMIFVIDREDHIVYVNSYVLEQFRVRPDAIAGQPRSNWFGKSDIKKTRKQLEQVFDTGEPCYTETEMTFPYGTLYLSTWLVPLKDQSGVVENVLGVSHDISELKKLENSLKETNLQLEANVEKRTVELRESHNRLRTLTRQIVLAQEEERRRISRELHDEAGQTLIGLRFSLDNVYRELPADLDSLRRRMEKALGMTDQTLKLLRTLAYDLRPPTLDLMGVNLGLKELCREFSDRTGIKVEYSGFELGDLSDEISISFYRFVQEALTNVAKHARANKVQVVFEYQDETIKASVQDNGRGISFEDGKPGLGMVGIKERFDILGGWLEVKSTVPKGTLIQVSLPWKEF